LSIVKPNICENGTNGIVITIVIIRRVANNKYLLGLLLNIGFLVLITSTTMDAEMTDSVNHAVLN
jgi:hypothetical protein